MNTHNNSTAQTTDDVLTTDQAAEFLKLNSNTLRHWRRSADRRVPFHRIGGSVRYLRSDLVAYLAANRTETE